MAEDVVLYEVDDRVALVTLNRPDRMNAWTGEMERRYFDLLQQAADDPDVGAIVVTGAGRGFCPGADMDLLQGIGGGGSGGGPFGEVPRPVTFPTTIPKPIVAAINGACAGVGLVQALMADVRFAASGVKFTTAFPPPRPDRRVRLVVAPAPPRRHVPCPRPADVGPRREVRGG